MIELRKVTDIDELMAWRKEVIANVFGIEADEALAAANRQYYEHHIPDGSHRAFVATDDGIGVGCGAICLSEELPSPDNQSGRCAFIMNIYVKAKHRNCGVAHQIVRRLVDEAKRLGCGKIYLESTDMAKPLYQEIGFKDMQNMMKI
ncbi:MAG: GNAT family N-acetyltransferase [Pseudoflavonifractor sp.]|nr:GNAT family N-acetyltransferase [Alloprevotella sp.]MCM1116148.1 GNAT family N-acetyltransferase [Pseudoflavonifractor sp.]